MEKISRKSVLQRELITITGQVQGVGFRPFVYRLAQGLRLTGWVLNDGRGVTIEAQGLAESMAQFTARLQSELPPLAQIAHLHRTPMTAVGQERSFEIRLSPGGELSDAQVTVDTAVCGDCLAEMNNPADPRYRYPFINCTNCGPPPCRRFCFFSPCPL